MGIDPGYAIVGCGIIEYNQNRFRVIEQKPITTPAKTAFNIRLEMVYNEISDMIEQYRPDAMSIEKLYFNTNTTTAIAVAEARGVILLAAQQLGLPVFEYTPLQIKQAVTGYGRADKTAMIQMTKMLLGLKENPKPDDVADALAAAICHAHSAGPINSMTNRSGF